METVIQKMRTAIVGKARSLVAHMLAKVALTGQALKD